MKRFILFLNLFLVFAGTLTAQTVTTIDALKTALVSGTESTITLGADGLELNSVITTSRTVTLDLNNHTLSTDCQEGALTVTGGGNLTIKNGTLAGERGDFLTAKGGTINLESTLIVTGYSSIVWAYNGGVVNINGAKLHTTNTSVAGCTSGEYAAVSATNNGTIVVNEGSEVKADRKSALRCLTGGTITVNGGNIISEANGDSGDGAVLCSGGTYVINNGTFTTPNTETVKINSGSITVNGGTFTTCESCNVVFMKTNGTVTLKGGTYNRNVTPYVAQGYTCIQTGDVKWTVTQGLVQRTSGTTVTYYPTLKLAADASIAGDEIKLLADFTSTEVATFAFPVTLDLNGKTLTVSVSKGLTVNSSEVVKMTNGTITSTENPVYNIGGLTIENVSITTTNAGDVHAILTEGNNAVLNVEGANTSIKAVEGGAIVAKDGATLNINNGAMENVHSVTNNTPTVWISNATANVNGETTSILSTQGNALGATAGATVTINNGTLNSQGTNGSPTAYSEGGNSKIIVNGGIIKSKTISALTASAGKVEINGGNILTEEQSNYPVVWQILLTRYDFDDRQRYINIRNSINELLLRKDVIPIINENDSIAVDEINFGDNDTLSAIVAASVQADMLFILTDVDGLYDGIPKKSKIIGTITKITDDLLEIASPDSSSGKGTGGMKTKLIAAKIAASSGTTTFITNGSKLDLIEDAVNGKDIGTKILPNKKLQSRKSWIAFGKKAKGFVLIDANATVAIRNKEKSLLSSGIITVGGSFNRGDTISVVVLNPIEQNNIEVARGLSNYNSIDLLKIAGKSSAEIKKEFPNMICEEVIHKDNLVVIK